MITLKLRNYSKLEREQLAYHLESVQKAIEMNKRCNFATTKCSSCEYRHLCSDLLSAAVFVNDYIPDIGK